jgi:transmembrane sensor
VRLAAVDLAPTPGPVAARDSGIVLRAGERGVVAPVPGRGFAAARVDGSATAVADDTAWTSGRLVFRDAPLVEVAGALRRWYGVELRVADPTLARRHLTATFRGEPLPEVLRVVGLALGARVDRRGDTVVVRPAR